MKVAVICLAHLAVLGATAPTKRATGPTDADILNYALTLEHLEDNFYRQGLANFTLADFTAAGFNETTYNRIKSIAADEASHVKFLTDGLTAAGGNPVAECTYGFGVSDVKSFMATASILEGVGVSAYLGAAADIMSKTYLTAAASILTVEARHSSYIRQTIGEAPFPQAFDAPLSYNQVYTLAAQFIKSCPSTNAALPVKAFPALMASSNTTSITQGSNLTFTTPGYRIEVPTGSHLYAAFITVTGPIFVDAMPALNGFTATVPMSVNGQTYIVLTSCNTAATDETIIAGPAIIEITN